MSHRPDPVTQTSRPPAIAKGQRWKVVVARLRPWLVVVALVVIVVPVAASLLGLAVPDVPPPVFLGLLAVAMLAQLLPLLALDASARSVESPVRGRWRALNSPADRVPSHGTLGYGQSHAIDLLLDPEDGSHPEFGTGAGLRAPEDFPGFGVAVHAPVDGVVVAASQWRRDHRSRSRAWTIPYLLVEGMVREFGGAGFVVGNHVVIRTEDGVHVLLAHLKQGSLEVERADRVAAGQVVAACGNSGNSSEPHLHLQLMDHPRASMAAGLPFTIDTRSDTRSGTGSGTGSEAAELPTNGSHLRA